MTTNFSLILPCYNEEENISHLYNEFKKIPLKNENAELIFVNNGSTDHTEKKIDETIEDSKSNNNFGIIVKKVNLKTNKGYGGGISAGLNSAEGDYIGWAHADLQTPLKDFLKLFEEIKDSLFSWFNGNSFFKLKTKEKKLIDVKIDGNRQIVVYTKGSKDVMVIVEDLSDRFK